MQAGFPIVLRGKYDGEIAAYETLDELADGLEWIDVENGEYEIWDSNGNHFNPRATPPTSSQCWLVLDSCGGPERDAAMRAIGSFASREGVPEAPMANESLIEYAKRVERLVEARRHSNCRARPWWRRLLVLLNRDSWPTVKGGIEDVRPDLIALLERLRGMPESAWCWLRVWSSDDERAWVEYARDGSDAWLIIVSYRQTDAPEVALARSGITLPGWCRISKWRANGVLFKGYIELSGSPPSLEALLDLGNTAVAVFAQAPRESDVCAEVLGR